MISTGQKNHRCCKQHYRLLPWFITEETAKVQFEMYFVSVQVWEFSKFYPEAPWRSVNSMFRIVWVGLEK